MSLYTATEVSILLHIKGTHPSGLSANCGFVRVPSRLIEARRAELGLPEGARVAIEVPRAKGSTWVTLEEVT